LGADVIVAVNLNGDLLAKRFPTKSEGLAPSAIPTDILHRMFGQLPAATQEHAAVIALRLLPQGASSPGYFEVLNNAIAIMQDHITRTRLAGEPPHVMLTPRLSDIGLMDFNRAKEAIAEGRACAEQALPFLQHYL
jgi:NTE family protein